ncbi:MAG TPA: serine hydrolase domain-containing protein [Pyrinomonadaceae bacterium]|nr:serine hydrolase domain-containing protein [Pyrinomonadaceae bacterium]
MASVASAFMKEHSVPGLSVAVAHHGDILYEEAFGFADRGRGERLTPGHLFRIASVTKPFTSAAIFMLIEQGRLKLEDVIFGPSGLLRGEFGEPPYKQYVGQIRLKHLLTHTAGGWPNDGTDPMFRNPHMNHRQLITWALANVPLTNPPGEHYAYSNFGYCILGRVIEKVTGRSYERHLREGLLRRCGISRMETAGNTLAERAPGEVVYYGQGGGNPYEMNVRRMDSHGGWLASASDLVRFATRVDGMSSARDVLSPASIREMTTATAANPQYAKGWAVNSAHNWWHVGSLPGTTSIIVRTGKGLCWAALANTREAKSNTGGAMDRMMWEMVRQVRSWAA